MLQRRLARVGLSKQTAKGTPATSATYDLGLLSGSVAAAEVAESDLNPTATVRVLSYVERTGIMPGATFQVVAMQRSIGLLLLAACGQVVTTAGVAPAPNSHVFKTADDLPYMTLFGRFGGQYLRVPDGKVDQLALSFDSAGSLRAEATLMGLDVKFDGTTAYTLATDAAENPTASPPLIGAGGLFELDGAAAKVKSGSLTISNAGSSRMLATSIAPDDIDVGMQEVSFSLVVVPTDLGLWRKRITGAATGTALSGDPFIGAASMKWVRGTDRDLTFAASRCVLATDMPDVDPAGGPAEVTVEGRVLVPTTGDAYTLTLRNVVASY